MGYRRRNILHGGVLFISAIAGCSAPFSDGNAEGDNRDEINQLEPLGNSVKVNEESDKSCGIYAMNILLETTDERLPSRNNKNILYSPEPLRVIIHIVKNGSGEVVSEPEHSTEVIQEAVPKEVAVNCNGEMHTFNPELEERITTNTE